MTGLYSHDIILFFSGLLNRIIRKHIKSLETGASLVEPSTLAQKLSFGTVYTQR